VAEADQLVELARTSAVPVVRVPSGGQGHGRASNEHIWLVVGSRGFDQAESAKVRELLAAAFPALSVRGGKRGSAASQMVRPPAALHRSGVAVRLADPESVFATLCAPTPPAHGWAEFLDGLAGIEPAVRPRKPPTARSPRQQPRVAAGADAGELPAGVGDRSAFGARRILELHYGEGWSVERITELFLVAPVGQYLRDRPGSQELESRVRTDVERVVAKYPSALGPAAHRRRQREVRRLRQLWPLWSMPSCGWFTRSGRDVLRAMLEVMSEIGTSDVTTAQRTLAERAGVSAATVGRCLHRLAEAGLVRLLWDDDGRIRGCRPNLEAIAALVPAHERSETDLGHTPLSQEPQGPDGEAGEWVDDAYVHRPAGSPVAPRIGRPGQRMLALIRRCPATRDQLATATCLSRDYVAQLLRRLSAHGLITNGSDGRWWVADGLARQLTAAATRLGTAGLLARRATRHVCELERWTTSSHNPRNWVSTVRPLLARSRRTGAPSEPCPGLAAA
jgi:DNA-binding IscR family transcriptional regulator